MTIVSLVVVGLCWIAAIGALLRRRSTRTLRERRRWHAAGACAGASLGLLVLLVGWLLRKPDAGGLGAVLATIILALSFVAASTRLLRLGDQALVGAAMVTAGALALGGVGVVVSTVLGRRPTNGERPLLIALTVTAVAAAALTPRLFRRIRDRLQSRFDGARSAPDTNLRTFGSRLARAWPLDELLLQLCESLKATMALSHAEVWTGADPSYALAASVPHRSSDPLAVDDRALAVAATTSSAGSQWLDVWIPALSGSGGGPRCVAPLVRDAKVLGFIVVGRPPSGDTFDEHEQEVLVDLARSVALALHNAQLDSSLAATLAELREQAADLRASRARLVAAADEERRRIERDLHDGAQQQLVALAVNLRTARQLLRTDPAALDGLLGELADEAIDAAAEVRDLAHGVYPPLLRESGLAGALRASVARARRPVQIEVPSERFAADVEAAVYFACLEGMQNAAKHAAGASVDVRITLRGGTLHFEVSDAGSGLDVGRVQLGRGMDNVRDRIGAVGGRVTWTRRQGGGTTMSGTVPLSG